MKKYSFIFFFFVGLSSIVCAQELKVLSTKKIQVSTYGDDSYPASKFGLVNRIVQLSNNRLVYTYKIGAKKSVAYIFDEKLDIISEQGQIPLFSDKGVSGTGYVVNKDIYITKTINNITGFVKINYPDDGLSIPSMTPLSSKANLTYCISSISDDGSKLGVVSNDKQFPYYWEKYTEVKYTFLLYDIANKHINEREIALKKEIGEYIKFINIEVDDAGNIYFLINVTNNDFQIQKVFVCIVKFDENEPILLPITIPGGLYIGPIKSIIDRDGGYHIFVECGNSQYYQYKEGGKKTFYTNVSYKNELSEFKLDERYNFFVERIQGFPVSKTAIAITFSAYDKIKKEDCLYVGILDSYGKIINEIHPKADSLEKAPRIEKINGKHYIFYSGIQDHTPLSQYVVIENGKISPTEYTLNIESGFGRIDGFFTLNGKKYLWAKNDLKTDKKTEFLFLEIE